MVECLVTSLPLATIEEDTSDSSSDTEKTPSRNTSFSKTSIPVPPQEGAAVDYPKGKRRRKKGVTVCLTNCRYDVIRRTASKFGYKEVSEGEAWNLYWTDLSISIERCKEMKRYQKINHFPGMLEICRKDLLARNLNRMLRLFPKDYNFFPKTWCLPADLGEVLSYGRLRKNKTFILKPDAGSQGRGILLTKNLKEIKPSDRVICQVYMSRPFLIDGYKFDLRVYTLVTSCEPLRIYVYEEGLCRFATSRYKEPTGVNITNVFMHLTNYAVNKHSRTYNVDAEGGSKRKLSWLYSYLRSIGHDVEKLWHRIDDVIIKTVISAYPVLKHSYSACFPNHDIMPACCELLGTDIILDRKLNPHILEVNHSPSFHTDTALDCEVKESLLTDMFAIMNLELCDKRKIMREDKKRVRDRLLHGATKDNQAATRGADGRTFADYYKRETSHRGNFRLVYPLPSSDHIYGRFFNQGQGSLYCDTAASRARETAQTMLRGEMQAKIEATRRLNIRQQTAAQQQQRQQQQRQPSGPVRPKPEMPRLRHSIPQVPMTVGGSFEPQMIVEADEKERIQRLHQRDYLVRSSGLLEHVYVGLKVNGVLRPQDERKFSALEKMRCRRIGGANGPTIVDLLDGIKGGVALLDNRKNGMPVTWSAVARNQTANGEKAKNN